ncbi:MAG TPA: plastocyanin/azurin family copper-binding protein [Solirubrobacteraceae bacterium]|nr:plastocyanin/azurin family copper-binding protein [Solirubrobacteraceae bacterium]
MRKLILIAVVAAFAAVPAVSALASTPATNVSITNNHFKPKTLTVKRGTRVTWVWHSFGVFHNVTVKSGPSKFHSANKGGGTYSHLFGKKGTYQLVCTLHRGMKETIVVR